MSRLATAVSTLLKAVTEGVKQAVSPPDKAEDTPTPAANPFTKATDDLRTTAKWLLAAFAAVGALFAAGVQLTGAGDLTKDMPSRLVAAVAGFALVVIGVVLAIYSTAKVLRVDLVSLNDIVTKEHLKELTSNTELVEPFESVAELQRRLQDLRPKLAAAEENLGRTRAAQAKCGPATDEATKEGAEQALRDARADLVELQRAYSIADAARGRALDAARLLDVRKRFKDSARAMTVGAILVAVGLLGFVWGANPPDPGKLPTAAVLPQTPTEVKFLLTEKGRSQYKQVLGAECKLDGVLEGIAMSVSGQEYQVATKRQNGCSSAWLTLGPALAQVSPAEDAQPAPSKSASGSAANTPAPTGSATPTATPK